MKLRYAALALSLVLSGTAPAMADSTKDARMVVESLYPDAFFRSSMKGMEAPLAKQVAGELAAVAIPAADKRVLATALVTEILGLSIDATQGALVTAYVQKMTPKELAQAALLARTPAGRSFLGKVMPIGLSALQMKPQLDPKQIAALTMKTVDRLDARGAFSSPATARILRGNG